MTSGVLIACVAWNDPVDREAGER